MPVVLDVAANICIPKIAVLMGETISYYHFVYIAIITIIYSVLGMECLYFVGICYDVRANKLVVLSQHHEAVYAEIQKPAVAFYAHTDLIST